MIKPPALLVEVTNRCNANCRICGRRWWKRGLGDLDYALYERLVALPYVERVCLGQYGEPTLWPHLVAATALAKRLGRYVWTTTNGQLVDAELTRGLLDAGLDKIIFSIDAIDRETYEHMRPGLQWKTVMGNLDRFKALGYVYVTLDLQGFRSGSMNEVL